MNKINLFVLIFVFSFGLFGSVQANTGVLRESIAIGKTANIDLGQSSSQSWQIIANSNIKAVSAVVLSNNLVLFGIEAGSSRVLVCDGAEQINCLEVYLSVGQVLGASVGHPVGSWILKGKTVYYVSHAGLIPVSTWEIFLSNGGEQKNLISASDADFGMPLLPIMSQFDSRLK